MVTNRYFTLPTAKFTPKKTLVTVTASNGKVTLDENGERRGMEAKKR